MKQKIVVIVGPTASGKSDLAVKLAQKYNGEIISADSRQVYRGLNIGTGKITKKEMAGIPHHLLNIASPQHVFSVQQYQNKAIDAINKIHTKNKLPIICGGTGFYIQAIVDNILFPEVEPNYILREKLALKSPHELHSILKKLDLTRAKNIDSKNPRRLIRAIEIATKLGHVPILDTQSNQSDYSHSFYSILQIGIQTEEQALKQKIQARLRARIKKGMIQEVKKLHEKGLSWKRMHQLGLEYKHIAIYLQQLQKLNKKNTKYSTYLKYSKEHMLSELNSDIWHYAKRQKTWFKRDPRILWFSLQQPHELEKLETKVADFLATA